MLYAVEVDHWGQGPHVVVVTHVRNLADMVASSYEEAYNETLEGIPEEEQLYTDVEIKPFDPQQRVELGAPFSKWGAEEIGV